VSEIQERLSQVSAECNAAPQAAGEVDHAVRATNDVEQKHPSMAALI
jgi:hypothetical protein